MLLIVEEGIHMSIYRYAKANNKCMKDYDKELSYVQYLNVNNLYGWTMLQKLPVNNFEWIKDTSQFNEDFIKNGNQENDERYLWNLMFNIFKNCMNFITIYHFYQKE